MHRQASALLVYDASGSLDKLTEALSQRLIQTSRVRTCEEASRRLQTADPPDVVFSETQLPDGLWSDVLRVAVDASAQTSVVVVARVPNMKLYIDVIEHGAFDFITPPFTGEGFDHVLRCAVGNALCGSQPGLLRPDWAVSTEFSRQLSLQDHAL